MNKLRIALLVSILGAGGTAFAAGNTNTSGAGTDDPRLTSETAQTIEEGTEKADLNPAIGTDPTSGATEGSAGTDDSRLTSETAQTIEEGTERGNVNPAIGTDPTSGTTPEQPGATAGADVTSGETTGGEAAAGGEATSGAGMPGTQQMMCACEPTTSAQAATETADQGATMNMVCACQPATSGGIVTDGPIIPDGGGAAKAEAETTTGDAATSGESPINIEDKGMTGADETEAEENK